MDFERLQDYIYLADAIYRYGGSSSDMRAEVTELIELDETQYKVE